MMVVLLAAVLAGAWYGLREMAYTSRLPPAVAARMPAHWRIPWGLKPEVRAAIEDLYSPQPTSRREAAHTLGNLGPDAAATAPFLIALLSEEPDPPTQPSASVAATPTSGSLVRQIRQYVVNSLWPPPTDEETSPPMATLGTAAEEAQWALTDIGPPAVDPLMGPLRDDDPLVRRRAAEVLGWIGDPRAVGLLATTRWATPRVSPPDPQNILLRVRNNKLNELDELDEASADILVREANQFPDDLLVTYTLACAIQGQHCLTRDPRIIDLLIKGAAENDYTIMPTCVEALLVLRRGEPADPRLIKRLLDGLANGDAGVAGACAKALVELRHPQAVDLLLARLNRSDDAPFGNPSHDDFDDRIVQALGLAGDPRAADPLLAALTRPLPRVSPGAVGEALARLHDPRAMPFLKPDSVEAFGQIKTEESTLSLLKLLKNPDIDTYLNAVKAVADRKDPRAIALIAARMNPSGKERSWRETFTPPSERLTRDCLEGCGPAAVEPLIKALADPDPVARGYAAEVLGTIGDARAYEPLLQMFRSDPDSEARIVAAHALARVGGSRALEPLLQAFNANVSGSNLALVSAIGHLRDPRVGDILLARLRTLCVDANGVAHDPLTEAVGTPEVWNYMWALLDSGDPRGIALWVAQFGEIHDLSSGPDPTPEQLIALGPAAVEPLGDLVRRNKRGLRVAVISAAALMGMDDPAARQIVQDELAALPAIRLLAAKHLLRRTFYETATAIRLRPALLRLVREDPDRMIRMMAAAALTNAYDPAAFEAIREVAAADRSATVRRLARHILARPTTASGHFETLTPWPTLDTHDILHWLRTPEPPPVHTSPGGQ
jgi:HEAT repeat protein